jgi:Zn-dependent peptidase ImmA (M78 family)
MSDLKEAESLSLDYVTLMKFAQDLDRQTKIRELFEIQSLIELMGGNIIILPLKEWEVTEIPFFSVESENKFTICLCSDLDNEMKRLMLVQALGHYTLHGYRGQKPCKVTKMAVGDAAREGFIFSLGLLMPDQMIAKMIDNKFSLKEIGHIFRVPEKIVEIKKNVLKRYNLLSSVEGLG